MNYLVTQDGVASADNRWRAPVSLYHVHARRYEGQLGAPDARYDFQSRDTDDFAQATAEAQDLAGRGFDVVIYDHGHREALPGASDYREIARFWPNGRVEHSV